MVLCCGILPTPRIKNEKFKDEEIKNYLKKIPTKILLAYGVYQVEKDLIYLSISKEIKIQ